jgi:hypothetical protein
VSDKKHATEYEKFDVVVGKLLAVSHEELKRREKKYQEQRAKIKRAKTSPASRASGRASH